MNFFLFLLINLFFFSEIIYAALSVNKHPVTPLEETYINWIAKYTVPNLRTQNGDQLPKDQRCERAAVVTWWTLKDGNLNTNTQKNLQAVNVNIPNGNVWGYSLCYNPNSKTQKMIGPLDTCGCIDSECWQLGIAGVQYGNYNLDMVKKVGLKLYKPIRGASVNIGDVLDITLKQVIQYMEFSILFFPT
ncbi:SH3 domain-containing protein [Gigaspora margarita]|uniref:SH3 domain-containing protein n=1 Tax=Gigaspora margarita TaxID=4874 RepID=A0A8H3XJG1_GIGMA|nr:SH3 domain-containing protein [Gigaspora margarita]